MQMEFLNWKKMKEEMNVSESMLKAAFSKWEEFTKNNDKFSIPSAVNFMFKEESPELKAKGVILVAAVLLELNLPEDTDQDLNYIS